jgi:hypothetical protein
VRIKDAVFSCDVLLQPVGNREYLIPHPFRVELLTDGLGVIVYDVAGGFVFDGRSGGPMVDFIAPNLGTQEEAKAWLLHDINGHDVCLSFEEANQLLYDMLRKDCRYGYFRAKAIYCAVSASSSWFGEPKPGDLSYPNRGKIKVRHYAKL